MTYGSITLWKKDGDTIDTVRDLFSWAPKLLQMVTLEMKLKDSDSLEENL